MRTRLTAILAVFLSVVLQFAPLCRQFFANLAAGSSPLGIIFRWSVGAGALMGVNHAVSGASGIVITSAAAKTNKNGGKLLYPITISELHAFSYWATLNPNPPGPPQVFDTSLPANLTVTIFTNAQGYFFGYLTNSTPVISTPPGVYAITLYAFEGTFYSGHRTPGFTFTWTVTGTNPAPQIIAQPTNQVVAAGGNVTFGVTVTNVVDQFYQWRLNSNILASATNAQLALTNVGGADEGSYSVIVSNVFGAAISANATLRVTGLPLPTVTTSPSNLLAIEGNAASIFAIANGAAPSSYRWRKNGVLVGGQPSASLTLSGVTTNDVANYTVIVTNSSGAATSSPPTSLTMIPAPQLRLSNTPPNQVAMRLTQYPGATYSVDYSDSFDAVSWQLWSNLPSAGAVSNVLLSAPLTNGAQFYRVRLSVP